MWPQSFLIIFLSSSLIISGGEASFNFYMKGDEVKRILGLPTTKDLFYIREGVPNTYALNFVVPLASNITFLRFTWDTTTASLGTEENQHQHAYNYTLRTSSSDIGALATPTPSYLEGTLPTVPESVEISIPCSGGKTLEVLVQIEFNVTSTVKKKGKPKPETTSVVVKRSKVCVKGDVQQANIKPLKKSEKKRNKEKEEIFKKNPINEETPENLNFFIILGVALGFFGVLVLVLISVALVRRRFRNKRQIRSGPRNNFLGCGSTSSSSTNTTTTTVTKNKSEPCYYEDEHFYSSVILPPEHYEHYSNVYRDLSRKTQMDTLNKNDSEVPKVERCKIRLETLLLEGNFTARLYLATLQEGVGEMSVLVKTAASSTGTNTLGKTYHEALRLAKFRHRNIMQIKCIAADFLVYDPPSSSEGYHVNLKKFMQNQPVVLDKQDLQEIGVQIAEGLTYLHEMGVAHGEVAARNCWMTILPCSSSKCHVRLSDSFLSTDFFPEDYETILGGGKLPLRWMSPEDIEAGVYYRSSYKGDLWSFGVFLYEIFSSGSKMPYSSLPISEVLPYLKANFRLERPHLCTEEMYFTIMRELCWGENDVGMTLIRDVLHKVSTNKYVLAVV